MNYIFLLIIVSLFYNCKNTTVQKSINKESNKLYIKVIGKSDSIFDCSINTSDTLGNKSFFFLKSKMELQEINLDQKSIVLIGNNRLGFDELLVYPGDTVLVTLGNKNNLLVKVNNQQKFRSYNQFLDFFMLQNSNIYLKIDSISKIIYKKLFATSTIFSLSLNNAIDLKTRGKLLDSLISYNEQLFAQQFSSLNDLNQKGNINTDYFEWLNSKLFYDLLSKQHKFITDNNQDYSKYVFNKQFQNSTLISSYIPSYRNFLETTFLQRVILKDKKIIIGKNQYSFDYNNAFYNCEQYLNLESSSYLQFFCLRNIYIENSKSTYKIAFDFFNKSKEHQNYVEYLNSAFKNNMSDTNTFNTLLYNINGEKINLRQVLEKNKGYKTYIDLWASWCIPCRETIHEANDVKKIFEKKKIKFIYLSIDNNFLQWKTAIKYDKIDKEEESFFVINSKESLFIKEINLLTIPRYLIVDENGKLINKNAPNLLNTNIYKLLSQ